MNIREEIRKTVIGKVEALKQTFTPYTLAIEYTNSKRINLAEQVNPFMRVSIVYQDGSQINLGSNPGHRLMGTIVLEALVKEGSGTGKHNELLGHFYPSMQMSDKLLPLRTQAAAFSPGGSKDGWFAEAALIPFWADSLTP